MNRSSFALLLLIVAACAVICEAEDDPKEGHLTAAVAARQASKVESVPHRQGSWQPWTAGCLDIHHISTGRGDAAYLVFPDGTTMLFDAGDLDAEAFTEKHGPLKVSPARPDNTRSPGAWIANYVRQVAPEDIELQIDYALISHFHGDHYGSITRQTPHSSRGPYRKAGITEVADLIPIRTIIDRGYPTYDFPVSLQAYYHDEPSTFRNYLAFIRHHVSSESVEAQSLVAGSNKQICLRLSPDRYPNFEVRNVKVNGTIWSGESEKTFEYFSPGDVLDARGRFNENPLSLAIKVSYGDFDYFTGGDLTGLQGKGQQEWFDVETPTALAVGKVEATVLNHHGNRDATNESFLAMLSPRTIIQQAWCSDHPGQEVLHRLISQHLYEGPREIFATSIQHETQVTYGPHLTRYYSSLTGHVVIRVSPGGDEYYVLVLDDCVPTISVKEVFGPYPAN